MLVGVDLMCGTIRPVKSLYSDSLAWRVLRSVLSAVVVLDGVGREGFMLEDGGWWWLLLRFAAVVLMLANLLLRDLFSVSRLVTLLVRVLLDVSVDANLLVSWLIWDWSFSISEVCEMSFCSRDRASLIEFD